ncbi:WhiB family transcriptional regulator [Mycobacterium sp. 852013-50091_SCH5140682]|uniref:WhiB family transcriptional regulator n=1 Tax=Mycobacterium sp. 852013-50091_SCH5140682 TaxID=1834109 RepID=UPI000B222D11
MTDPESWGWRVRARCRGEDLGLFFHPDGERGHARRRRQELAKQLCAQCPVVPQCREHAVAYEEAFGIWGGLTEDERSRQLPDRAVRLRTHRAHERHDMTDRGESSM